jgi:hypothetical protein
MAIVYLARDVRHDCEVALKVMRPELAISAQSRHPEAIGFVEHATALSRAPIFVSVVGFGYAQAGRLDDAGRLLTGPRAR